MLFPISMAILISFSCSTNCYFFRNKFTGNIGTVEHHINPSEIPSKISPSPISPLAESLSKAFPSNLHQNPAYASVLVYLNSLEKKPSCYRTATADLISECNSLDSSQSPHGDLRYQYATQLAVCEFEATGISYPSECLNIAQGTKDQRGPDKQAKCIRRLEERPQWWTTLSNNIQNAMVICAAVRHEVEQGMGLLKQNEYLLYFNF
jgi:hypothetical protein